MLQHLIALALEASTSSRTDAEPRTRNEAVRAGLDSKEQGIDFTKRREARGSQWK